MDWEGCEKQIVFLSRRPVIDGRDALINVLIINNKTDDDNYVFYKVNNLWWVQCTWLVGAIEAFIVGDKSGFCLAWVVWWKCFRVIKFEPQKETTMCVSVSWSDWLINFNGISNQLGLFYT